MAGEFTAVDGVEVDQEALVAPGAVEVGDVCQSAEARARSGVRLDVGKRSRRELGDALPPGTASIIAIYDRAKADTVD